MNIFLFQFVFLIFWRSSYELQKMKKTKEFERSRLAQPTVCRNRQEKKMPKEIEEIANGDSAIKENEQTGMFVNYYDLPCDEMPRPTKLVSKTKKLKLGKYNCTIYNSKFEWGEPSPYGWDYSNEEYYPETLEVEELEEFKRKMHDLRSDWAKVRNYHYDWIPADSEYCKENFVLDDEGHFLLDSNGNPQVRNETTSYEKWLQNETYSDDKGILRTGGELGEDFGDKNIRAWEKGHQNKSEVIELPKGNVQEIIGWEAKPTHKSEVNGTYETSAWNRNPTGLSNEKLWKVYESPTGKISDGLTRGPNCVNLWKFNVEEIDQKLRKPTAMELIMKSLEEKNWEIKE